MVRLYNYDEFNDINFPNNVKLSDTAVAEVGGRRIIWETNKKIFFNMKTKINIILIFLIFFYC